MDLVDMKRKISEKFKIPVSIISLLCWESFSGEFRPIFVAQNGRVYYINIYGEVGEAECSNRYLRLFQDAQVLKLQLARQFERLATEFEFCGMVSQSMCYAAYFKTDDGTVIQVLGLGRGEVVPAMPIRFDENYQWESREFRRK